MTPRDDVLIVGTGLAGLAAAEVLSRFRLRIRMVDDNRQAGGQLLRGMPQTALRRGAIEWDGAKLQGAGIVARLRRRHIACVQGAEVLGVFPQHTLLVADNQGRITQYQADHLIFATGAREKHLPFPGWTLPGVFSTGAAQILIKSAGILPARNLLIAGNSPLMLVLAGQLCTYGARVAAILDRSSPACKLRALNAGPAIWSKLPEGLRHGLRLAACRVPIHQRMGIIAAQGSSHLESVVAARIDRQGRFITGTERVFPIQALAVGHGFAPNIELPRQAGCRVVYAADKGGWHIDVDRHMQTSLENMYAIGETTGIAGAAKSIVEGQMAGWAVLRKLAIITESVYQRNVWPLRKKRYRQLAYGRYLNQLCRVPVGSYAAIADETVICRCEAITMGAIRRQMAHGFITLNSLKKATRSGMGTCQGRICGPMVFDIIQAGTGQSAAQIGCAAARAPVKAVSLGAMAQMENGNEVSTNRPFLSPSPLTGEGRGGGDP